MASLDLLTPHLSKIKIPGPQQLIYKDECVYSFDNPESDTGLYVSLVSFLGFGRNYVEQYFQKTGNNVFVHIKRDKKPIPEPEQTGDGPEKKITRLAIGVEGGFDPTCGRPKFTYTDHYNVVVLPGFHTYPWPNPSLPDVYLVAEEDKDPDDKYQYNRKTVLEKGEEYTERPYYNRAGYENVALEADNAVETTTQPIDFEMSEKIYKDDGLDNLNLDRQINLETNNLEKQVIDQRVDEKKFEVYAGDIDEESILSGGVLTSVSVRPSTATTEYATQAKRSRTKMRHLNLESIDSESIDKKSKLEWIEENFGREREKEMETGDPDDFNITTPRSVTYRTLSTATSEKADLSVLTKEIVDDDKRRKANLNAEDIIFKKQMDLLNSLDYGTEKAEFDESESKDGNVDERYPSDTFPTYFR